MSPPYGFHLLSMTPMHISHRPFATDQFNKMGSNQKDHPRILSHDVAAGGGEIHIIEAVEIITGPKKELM